MSHRAAIRESLAAACDLIGQKKKKIARICMLCHAPPCIIYLFSLAGCSGSRQKSDFDSKSESI